MERLAQPKDFCPNPACRDYGKLQNGKVQSNLKKIGHTHRGVQRYQCKTCGRTFTETLGTIFYRKHAKEDEILEMLALLAEGTRISMLTRVKGIKEDTSLRWLREAAKHTDQIDAVLMKDFHIKPAQLDGLWSFVGNKGEKNYPETDESGTFWIIGKIPNCPGDRSAIHSAGVEDEPRPTNRLSDS